MSASEAQALDAAFVRRRRRMWNVLGFFGGGLLALVAPIATPVVALVAGSLGAMEMAFIVGGSLLFIGVVQGLWIVPMVLATALYRPTRGVALGLMAGAALIFLLNAGCYGLMLTVRFGGAAAMPVP